MCVLGSDSHVRVRLVKYEHLAGWADLLSASKHIAHVSSASHAQPCPAQHLHVVSHHGAHLCVLRCKRYGTAAETNPRRTCDHGYADTRLRVSRNTHATVHVHYHMHEQEIRVLLEFKSCQQTSLETCDCVCSLLYCSGVFVLVSPEWRCMIAIRPYSSSTRIHGIPPQQATGACRKRWSAPLPLVQQHALIPCRCPPPRCRCRCYS